MPLCTELSLVNHNGTEGEISMLKCKRWSCENCNPTNRWKVICKARDGLPNIFLTLTVPPHKYADADEQARDMRRGLVLFRRRIAERWGVKNIPFIVVFEKHKSGAPHMHLMMRGPYLHQKVLLGMWRNIMGSGGVNIQFVSRKDKKEYYITKYIGKDLGAFEGCKRWWRSQNWSVEQSQPPERTTYGDRTYVTGDSYEALVQFLERQGYNVEEKGRYRATFTRGERAAAACPVPWHFPEKRWR